ncbi:MAG: DUF2059 domain-containing protein [Bryobacteraceae bacterium]|jgi:hypothetical protein
MKHSRTLIGFAAAFLLTGAVRADDASKMAKVQELFQVAKIDQGFKQMLDKTLVAVKAQAARQEPAGADKAALEQKVSEIASQLLSWDKLGPQFVKVYADTFTEEELDAILSFYKSPAGQAWFFGKSPEVGEKIRPITQQAMQEAQVQIRKVIEQATPAQQ